MSVGSWPYVPEQCPDCYYFRRFASRQRERDGSDTVGWCGNPRIAMELYEFPRGRPPGRCPLFLPPLKRYPVSGRDRQGSR